MHCLRVSLQACRNIAGATSGHAGFHVRRGAGYRVLLAMMPVKNIDDAHTHSAYRVFIQQLLQSRNCSRNFCTSGGRDTKNTDGIRRGMLSKVEDEYVKLVEAGDIEDEARQRQLASRLGEQP